MVTAQDIIAKAREYVGTPYHHQGRVKGVALDCVGLIFGVCEELGLVDVEGVPILRADNTNYSNEITDIFVHRECQRRLIERPANELCPGCVCTMRVPIAVHCGVASVLPGGMLGMIHAYNGGTFKCVEHGMDEKWRRRIAGVFKIPGVSY